MKDLIISVLEEINKREEVFDSINEDTDIYANVDSFLLLEIILDLENAIKNKHGKYIQLADQDIMDKEKSPFRKLKDLILYIDTKIDNG